MERVTKYFIGIPALLVCGVLAYGAYFGQRFRRADKAYHKAWAGVPVKIEASLTPTKEVRGGLVTKIEKQGFPITSGGDSMTEFPYAVGEIRDPENPEEEIRLVCPNTSSLVSGKRYNLRYLPDPNEDGKITYREIIEFGVRQKVVSSST